MQKKTNIITNWINVVYPFPLRSVLQKKSGVVHVHVVNNNDMCRRACIHNAAIDGNGIEFRDLVSAWLNPWLHGSANNAARPPNTIHTASNSISWLEFDFRW